MTETFKDTAAIALQAWDVLSIMKTVSKVAHAQDDLDRETYKSCFTDKVLLTASVMFPGREPKELSVDDLCDMYFAGLEKFDVGHHMVLNHIIDVEGDDATCVADLYGVAVLIEDGESKTSSFGGRYHLKLRRQGGEWRIYQRAVNVRYRAEGDAAFRSKVAARAEARTGAAVAPT